MDEKDEKERVINPFTGRSIVVGGRTYRLVEASFIEWLEAQCAAGPRPGREKVYCGNKVSPLGYTRKGTPYECLKKGFKTGLCSVYSRLLKEQAAAAARQN